MKDGQDVEENIYYRQKSISVNNPAVYLSTGCHIGGATKVTQFISSHHAGFTQSHPTLQPKHTLPSPRLLSTPFFMVPALPGCLSYISPVALLLHCHHIVPFCPTLSFGHSSAFKLSPILDPKLWVFLSLIGLVSVSMSI
jgi:hypothetical protein